MSEKKKRVKLKPEEFVSQHDKIEEGVVHTRLRNKDGRWLDMFDYVPEGIGVDRLTNDGTKTTKKERQPTKAKRHPTTKYTLQISPTHYCLC